MSCSFSKALASCWFSLCARLDLPKYLELALPRLVLSARRLYVAIERRNKTLLKPTALIGRAWPSHAPWREGLSSTCSRESLTQGATQSQPYFHAKPNPTRQDLGRLAALTRSATKLRCFTERLKGPPSRGNFKAAFLGWPMPACTSTQTTLPNKPLPKSWLVFRILTCWQWTSCGNARHTACASFTSWPTYAPAKLKSIASFLRRSSSKPFPAEGVTRQVAMFTRQFLSLQVLQNCNFSFLAGCVSIFLKGQARVSRRSPRFVSVRSSSTVRASDQRLQVSGHVIEIRC